MRKSKNFTIHLLLSISIVCLAGIGNLAAKNIGLVNSEPPGQAVLTSVCPERAKVIQTALSQLKVREETGKNDGEQVEKYLASTGLGKGYPWCAAFVNWCLVENDIKGPDKPAWSPSWFPKTKTRKVAGRPVKMEAGAHQELLPLPGDVFGIYFTSKKRIAHVGLVVTWTDPVITIEGNTNQSGSREGDGVYVKRRQKSQIYQVADWISNSTNYSLHEKCTINFNNTGCIISGMWKPESISNQEFNYGFYHNNHSLPGTGYGHQSRNGQRFYHRTTGGLSGSTTEFGCRYKGLRKSNHKSIDCQQYAFNISKLRQFGKAAGTSGPDDRHFKESVEIKRGCPVYSRTIYSLLG